MSITVFLEVQLRPDAVGAEAEAAIRETLAQTAAFDGNEGLEVLVDDADPTRVIVAERWATAGHHDAYVAWRQTPDGAAALGAVLAGPPVTRTFGRTIDL
ncbi:antibiotic biosynthesis monooxygenase [Modestobacter sp. VKM Ac-2986]|uniref:putative quinol monooxygenase n=1 Tax=Modestobacter sp. VKM Ac-2986 TaxID=3004140 RepID=UPI0022AB1866|nr:antibiotic biosynthesis monooxygenase family protein [Modestobacter sp. VKM Ac-2986]MCZ2829168.1 antibiotic biosynthesis monooxygenase [Modestobacter sp. VKM Ac-2986]